MCFPLHLFKKTCSAYKRKLRMMILVFFVHASSLMLSITAVFCAVYLIREITESLSLFGCNWTEGGTLGDDSLVGLAFASPM